MLKKIQLKNFRRHTDLSVNFEPGMTVIRALNEQGKSTLLEAIAYAMFGVKAIRDTLDDCVTWGEATNTLRVDLVFDVDGVEFNLKRAKSGAELNYSGGSVTGQTEVTNFVANLLKVDAASAARLTMSNQNEIRGALESGTKATTELIERLAEFDQLDELLELMQEKLELGSSATAEANLANAQRTLDAARDAAVPVDEAGLKQRMLDANDAVSMAVRASEIARAAEDTAAEALTAVREKIATRAALEKSVDAAVARNVRIRDQLAGLTKVPVPVNVDARVQALQDLAQAGSEYAALKNIADRVALFANCPAARMPGTVADLRANLTAIEERQSVIRSNIPRIEGDIKLAEQAKLAGSCSFCGKDFSGVPEVAAKNVELDARIAANHALLLSHKAELDSVKAKVDLARNTLDACADPLRLAREYPDNVAVVDDLLPPYLKWIGPALVAPEKTPAAIRGEIEELRSTYASAIKANERYDEVQSQLTVASADAARLKRELEDMPEVTADAEREAVTAARAASNEAANALATAREAATLAKAALFDAVAAFERAQQAVATAQADIERFEKAITALAFNNALLKKVRSARPVIADKLWNIVLSAVSGYFSEIRGEKSRVAKDSDGFKVDGHPITSLSGSTKDALGLAIRVALVRTFLPSSPFLILDEPAAAMDDGRTENLLGFIATCGFSQTLIVTHEDVSQSVADNIITL